MEPERTPAVNADARACRRLKAHDGARAWRKAVQDVLGVDAELESVAVRLRVEGFAHEGQWLARSDAELLRDDVHAGHDLSDWVLNLHTGVDLEEGDGAVLRDYVLHGSSAGVTHLGADGAGALVDAGALFVAKCWGRGFFDELLEAALRGTIAGAKHGDVAVGIGEDLRLDVARVGQELLHVALGAAEGLLGLASCRVEGRLNVFQVFHDLQTASAATISCLDGNRQTVLFSEGAGLLPVVDGVGGARSQGAPTSSATRRAAILSPSSSMDSGVGPIQVRPALATARAKSAFSERKP